MKSERIAIALTVILFLLIWGTYARVSQIEQRMTQQRIEGMSMRLDSLIATIRDSDSRYKSYSEDLKKVQDRVELMESEKKELWVKLDNLSHDLEGLRTSLAATNLDTNKKIVELGAISVKKNGNSKK